MGKGLGLSAESQAMHVAFTTGTGLFTFIDLGLLMALNHLKVPGVPQLHPDFKLTLYTSFRSPKEAMGLELFECLVNLGLPSLQLFQRFSTELSHRLDRAFIRKHMKDKRGV